MLFGMSSSWRRIRYRIQSSRLSVFEHGIVLGLYLNGGIANLLLQKIVVASVDNGIVAQGKVLDAGAPGEQAVIVGVGHVSIENNHTVPYVDIPVEQTVTAILGCFDTDGNQVLVVGE